jgi:hypothetical protein
MSPLTPPLWRAFPYDPQAEEGRPFSASFVPAAQGSGRFDMPGEPSAILYLAETAEHAVGEKVQDLRNQNLDFPGDIEEHGHPLALARVHLDPTLHARIVDLCDPDTLARLSIRPDDIAAADRTITQGISRRLYVEGVPGFRWWSVFFGEWHTVVLFRDRLDPPADFATPDFLHPDHPALTGAARRLGIRIRSTAE